MSNVKELIKIIGNRSVYIQTHNFPDHDAVASAFGLQELFNKFGILSHIVYEGEIQRDSLKTMIRGLDIELKHYNDFNIGCEDIIVIVDACRGNSNVSNLPGHLIGIIDHHEVNIQDGVEYNDIRPGNGACSSIIVSYFNELGLSLSREAASALLIGLNMDTALMTRGVSKCDIEAYSELYYRANIPLVNQVLRNIIQTKELSFYRYAIDNVKINNSVAFCYFAEGCNQNLLGILGDFLLALVEIDFVILCANNSGKINFSIRNEREEWNASEILQKALDGIGLGGGHYNMAGGIITDITLFNEEKIYEKFMELLK